MLYLYKHIRVTDKQHYNKMQTTIHKPVQKKQPVNRLLSLFANLNPFRTELVEVQVKLVGKRVVYTYTKVKDS